MIPQPFFAMAGKKMESMKDEEESMNYEG